MTTTITARGHSTVTLQEGQAINIKVDSLGAGMVYFLDDAAGRGNSKQSWTLAASQSLPIGPYAGTNRFRMTCSVGSVSYDVVDATVNVPQIVVSSSAPNNSDGRPDGTIYIQTS